MIETPSSVNPSSREYAIQLTGAEAALLAQIELDMGKLKFESAQSNAPAVVALMKSLEERKAIPEIRLRYWLDPDLNHGRIKSSHKGLFERNGTKGQEIFEHPHFLPYLRYFLFGADLPPSVISTMKERVGNPAWISSSDILPIAKFARMLARQSGLDQNAAEEFFKLALDLGLPEYTAGAIRKAVHQIR
ncbi:hypothetical protein [Bradyrhizobium cosmicum]|uniref:Uncharacterized protein n=1 Tax=Bradyrhizobium cosmicum TaxID=1404864 RepID=A0AAI8Q9Z2_9BRAD|nr:hypothetical protein [Bradyrhizobium cosmicum]BAL73736.1 hypothetical protein S23_05150 [Bradyrhizobium cosmicum]